MATEDIPVEMSGISVEAARLLVRLHSNLEHFDEIERGTLAELIACGCLLRRDDGALPIQIEMKPEIISFLNKVRDAAISRMLELID